MGISSINEPDASRNWMINPVSINEPPKPMPDGPVVTSLSPASAVAGSAPDITMHVRGGGFNAGSIITFNGLDEPTVYIGRTDITTVVKPSLFVVPAVCPVGVRNANGMVSNKVNFTFTAAAEDAAAPEQTAHADDGSDDDHDYDERGHLKPGRGTPKRRR